jgi:hypothetical protein
VTNLRALRSRETNASTPNRRIEGDLLEWDFWLLTRDGGTELIYFRIATTSPVHDLTLSASQFLDSFGVAGNSLHPLEKIAGLWGTNWYHVLR